MTLTVISTDRNVSTSTIYTAVATGDSVWLTAGTFAANTSSGGSGFSSGLLNWTAVIDGAVFTDGAAITASGGTANVQIGATGSVRSTNSTGNTVVSLFDGGNSFINRGDIFGGACFAVLAAGGDNHLYNSGTAFGGCGGYFLGLFGALGDTLVNSGTITAGTFGSAFSPRFSHGIQIDGDNATVLNSGTITSTLTGSAGINVGSGAAEGSGTIITNTASGVIESVLGIGIKANLLIGGSFTVINRGIIEGAQGSYLGGSGGDILRNVGTMVGDVSMGEGGNQLTNRGLIDGFVFFGSGNDTFTGTKGTITGSVSGGGGNDTLLGGNDGGTLYGGTGTDSLVGGSGADLIIGGAGVDTLTGGNGADDFQFSAKTDIGRGGTRETITDFTHLSDQIDLSAFMTGGSFIGSAAFSAVQQVRYTAATGLLEGDVDGNGTTDWALLLINKPVLTAVDFLF